MEGPFSVTIQSRCKAEVTPRMRPGCGVAGPLWLGPGVDR